MKPTNNVIDKELISHLLMLEAEQQEAVLAYIKSLLKDSERTVDAIMQSKLIARAKASTQSIKEDCTKSIDRLRKEARSW